MRILNLENICEIRIILSPFVDLRALCVFANINTVCVVGARVPGETITNTVSTSFEYQTTKRNVITYHIRYVRRHTRCFPSILLPTRPKKLVSFLLRSKSLLLRSKRKRIIFKKHGHSSSKVFIINEICMYINDTNDTKKHAYEITEKLRTKINVKNFQLLKY